MHKKGFSMMLNTAVIAAILVGLLPMHGDSNGPSQPHQPQGHSQPRKKYAPLENAPPNQLGDRASYHKVRVTHRDVATQQELAQMGATRLGQNGSEVFWKIPASIWDHFKARKSVASIDHYDLTGAYSGVYNPLSEPEPYIPENLRQKLTEEPQMWIVKYVLPQIPGFDWPNQLHEDGYQRVSASATTAILWLTGAQRREFQTLERDGKSGVLWTGPRHPITRVDKTLYSIMLGELQPPYNPLNLEVDMYAKSLSDIQPQLDEIIKIGGVITRQFNPSSPNHMSGHIRVGAEHLVTLVNLPNLWFASLDLPANLMHETQAQIVVGNITTNGGNTIPDNSTSYLQWLNSKGFTNDPATYPKLAILDSGIDIGTTNPTHPDLYKLGDVSKPSRVVSTKGCTTDLTTNDIDGHGTLVAGIATGYNNKTGMTYADSNNYHYGLGVSPFNNILNFKIFNSEDILDFSNCGQTHDSAGALTEAYNAGARVTNNSFGKANNGTYGELAANYDVLTRRSGGQQMLQVVSAGNSGPSGRTIANPGSAKDVLTVGASENVYRDGETDSCGVSAAGNADNIRNTSAQGPTADGRAKPDLVAPGTHVQGLASQDPNYTGASTCGTADPTHNNKKYYPIGQTLYTWSNGTSFAAPAGAGAAVLVSSYYQRTQRAEPSPAMIKAELINSARYLTGVGANDTLPSPAQGWGEVDLKPIFDDTPRILHDQTFVFTSVTDLEYQENATVAQSGKPLRVSLVWTDPVGEQGCGSNPNSDPLCLQNDLDLEVIVGSNVYVGNDFNGADSQNTNVDGDRLNNVENVFLPASAVTAGDAIQIRVRPISLVAKGVPGNSADASQDFALVVYNADEGPVVPSLLLAQAGNNQNADVNTAFPVQMQAQVRNNLGSPVSGVTVQFAAPTDNTAPTGTFVGGSFTAQATTNAQGIATAPVFTANGVEGSYNVLATVPSFSGIRTLPFGLQNLAACTEPFVVTVTNDHNDGECGSLSRALRQATSSSVITISTQSVYLLAELPAVPVGVKIIGTQDCDPANSSLMTTIDGSGIMSTTKPLVTLSGGNTLKKLVVTGYSGGSSTPNYQPLKATGGTGRNRLSCVVVMAAPRQ